MERFEEIVTRGSWMKEDRLVGPEARGDVKAAESSWEPLGFGGTSMAQVIQSRRVEGLTAAHIMAHYAAAAPAQTKRGGAPSESAAPRAGASESNLPEPVLHKMESAFGTDFSDVRISKGPEASSIGALAFAQGNEIHFAPGQYDPGSRSGQDLLGHELAHVVQQREGRVRPTTQAKGVAINDDPALEAEADRLGARAASGEQVAAAARGEPAQVEAAASGIQAKPSAAAPVQAKLAGSRDALEAAGGTGSRLARGASWKKVLAKLRDYEKLEQKHAGQMRPLSEPDAKKLIAKLDELEHLAERYLEDNAELLKHDISDRLDTDADGIDNDEVARRRALNEAQEALMKEEQSSAQGRQVRERGGLIKMLLPRIRLERSDIESGRWSPTERFEDRLLTGGEDDAVGGALNRLDRVEYGDQKGFFKQDRNTELATAGSALGIGSYNLALEGQVYDPNSGARAVAMSRLDELLGANLMAKTEFATHSSATGKAEATSPTAKLGTFMAKAEGKDAKHFYHHNRLAVSDRHKQEMGPRAVSLSHPRLQRSLNIMQIIDAIAGQLDRHPGNFMFKVGNHGQVEKVTGIDLDMAFAPKQNDASQQSGGADSHFKGLPVIYDREFALRVLQLDEDELRRVLAPLLSAEEVQAAVGRLVHVQSSIKIAMRTGRLIDVWNEQTARMQTNVEASYAGMARGAVFVHVAMDAIAKSSRPDAELWRAVLREVQDKVENPDLRPTHVETCIEAMDFHMRYDPGWADWQRLSSRLEPLEGALAGAIKRQHDLEAQIEPHELDRNEDYWQAIGERDRLQAQMSSLTANTKVPERDWAVSAITGGLTHYANHPDSDDLPDMPPAPELPDGVDELIGAYEESAGLV